MEDTRIEKEDVAVLRDAVNITPKANDTAILGGML